MHCICSHLSLFSAAVFPVPNKIDFIHDIELLTTINMNFYAAVMVGTLLLLLIILITWGRIMDKRDEIKVRIKGKYLILHLTSLKNV